MMVFKNVFNDLKLNRISYLLEIIETADFKKKVNAYNKLRKIKIDEESGHLIIDKVIDLKHKNKDNFNASISLLSLVLDNYYDSYSNHLYEAFKKLDSDDKSEFLNILAHSNDPSKIILYRILVFNFKKDLKIIPIGDIGKDKDNYELVFPELYEVLDAKDKRNSILILLNDFINLGIVPIPHINKYKKNLQKIIINIFKEGIKYKLDPKSNYMAEKEYIDLRILLEVAINIEYYVSSKETRAALDKLYKTKDNQLKLFILENYVRKEKNISKININPIAKDLLSRAPLYSFLVFSKLENLMPKKYRNNKDLSESELFLNYSISVSYNKIPYDIKLLEERIVDNYKYFIYKFKTPFDYNEEIIDPVTDYLLKNIKIDGELNDHGEITYIGIVGGYNITSDPSSIEKQLDGPKFFKYTDDYEKEINKILTTKKEEKKIVDNIEEPEEEPEKPSLLSRIFSFSKILSFASIVIILLFVILTLYVSNIDLFNIKKNTMKQTSIVEAVLLKPKELFTEISYRDIFNREESEYYVL